MSEAIERSKCCSLILDHFDDSFVAFDGVDFPVEVPDLGLVFLPFVFEFLKHGCQMGALFVKESHLFSIAGEPVFITGTHCADAATFCVGAVKVVANAIEPDGDGAI